MPLLNGLDAARKLRALVPDSRIIFLTMHADPTYASEAFEAGASGYLLKRSAASELDVAIATVLDGRKYLTPLIASEAFADKRAALGHGAADARQAHAPATGSTAVGGRGAQRKGHRRATRHPR